MAYIYIYIYIYYLYSAVTLQFPTLCLCLCPSLCLPLLCDMANVLTAEEEESVGGALPRMFRWHGAQATCRDISLLLRRQVGKRLHCSDRVFTAEMCDDFCDRRLLRRESGEEIEVEALLQDIDLVIVG